MRRVYIAGPMTGLPGFNFPAFHAEAAVLRARGLEVINPAELNGPPEAGKGWAECMRTDIRELVMCDGVHMLPGWERSKGASLERHIALTLGLVVTYAPVTEGQ